MLKSSIGKRANKRRSAIGFPNTNSSLTDSKGSQIFDRGKANETNGKNTSKLEDKRKHTVLRITLIKHAGNRATEQQKVLPFGNDPKTESNALSRASPQKATQDMLQDTRIPLTFQVNTKPSNGEDVPINKLLSDKPLPNDNHDLSANSPLEYPKTSPDKGENGSGEKSPKLQDKLEPNMVLEAKLNPLRIGIRLDDDKKKDAQNTSVGVNHVSLQDVLKDIDDSSQASNATGDENTLEKENSVIIDLNDDATKGSKPTIPRDDGKSGKVRLEATSHRDNKNGSEIETAGVSITTESKGLQSDGLMKVLLSKLLGSDISEALKGKVAKELKSVSVLAKPNDNAQKQRPISRPTSLDEASTTAEGTLVESPPGTLQGVDMAEMNNQAGGPTLAPPPLPSPMPAPANPAPLPPPPPPKPTVPQSHPGCAGWFPHLQLLNPAGDSVSGNVRPPGCSYEFQRQPINQIASTTPTGMSIESAPGTLQGVGTGIPSPAPIQPRPLPKLPSNEGMFSSTKTAAQGVESPPGTFMAVGTSTRINGMQRGDHGKTKW